jgi:hypothetical protein
MLVALVVLDIGSVFGGIALAVVAFVVVVLVCVVILRLLSAILPPYRGPDGEAAPEKSDGSEGTDDVDRAPSPDSVDDGSPANEAPVPEATEDPEG